MYQLYVKINYQVILNVNTRTVIISLLKNYIQGLKYHGILLKDVTVVTIVSWQLTFGSGFSDINIIYTHIFLATLAPVLSSNIPPEYFSKSAVTAIVHAIGPRANISAIMFCSPATRPCSVI